MSKEAVEKVFELAGMSGRVKELPSSSATVELAAAALGCEPARIAKSVTFLLRSGAVMVVAAGDTKIDNAKFRAYFGEKAKMLPRDEVLQVIGHAVGGVCPFAVNEGVRICFDRSLLRFETVFPACGSENSVAELSEAELTMLSGSSEWVDVCKSAK